MNKIVEAFIAAINAHDVDGLSALMTEDHTFIDPHGNQLVGKEQMTAGWRGYFDWFPDYYIEVTEATSVAGEDDGEMFAMFGYAGGSFKGNTQAAWRLPAAWKTVIRDGRVALWQVFADTKVPYDSMQNSG